jgi:RNA-directed DNA polymerase
MKNKGSTGRRLAAGKPGKDAEMFYEALPKRLGKFGLGLSEEKTRILSFSKYRMEENNRFEFLGFEFRWGKK